MRTPKFKIGDNIIWKKIHTGTVHSFIEVNNKLWYFVKWTGQAEWSDCGGPFLANELTNLDENIQLIKDKLGI